MPSNKVDEISRNDQRAGLSWPKEFKRLLPLIRESWGVEGPIYLNRVLGGGRSGALVYAADLTCRDFKGEAILKLDRIDAAEWSRDKEFERHALAFEISPDFAAQHLPRLVQAYQEGDEIAILSTIAGRGLQYATSWSDCPYKEQLSFARRISNSLLSSWNANYVLVDGLLEPHDLLAGWLDYRLDRERGRIGKFLSEDCGVDEDLPAYSFEGELYPNPLAFARGALPLPEKAKLRAVRGQMHGDLHGQNVLVASPPSGKPNYFLIDLEFYQPDGFLFYDHAYLEFTHLMGSRRNVGQTRWKSLLDNLSRFHKPTRGSGPKGDDLGLLKVLHTVRQGAMAWIDRHEPNRLSYLENQYLLARIAVGLTFCHRRLSQDRRCMAFTYAAANLRDYLQLNDIGWPKDGPAIAFAGGKGAGDPQVVSGARPESHGSSRSGSNDRSGASRWWIAPVVALALVAAGIAAWFQPWEPHAPWSNFGELVAPFPNEPSVAVLPFRNLAQGEQGAMLADGMSASISANLARVPQLFVTSRQSAAEIGGRLTDEVAAGRALGVSYVLGGSVQQFGNSIRVLAKLVNVKTGGVMWSARYDRELDNVFAVQDEIALNVLVALQVQLTEGFQAALRGETTNNLDAYLLYTSALDTYRSFTSEAMQEVRRLTQQAVDLDPEFGQAYALMAKTHMVDARFGYSDSAEKSLTQAAEILRVAALADDEVTDNERAEILIADAYLHQLAGRYDQAVREGREASQLSPNNADVLARYASILFFSGEYDPSIRLMERATRLSPIYPSWYALYLSRNYAFKGDTEKALEAAKDGIARAENNRMRAIQNANLAFVYEEAGRHEDAKAAAKEVLKLEPDFRLGAYRNVQPFRDPENWTRMSKALLAAGIPG